MTQRTLTSAGVRAAVQEENRDRRRGHRDAAPALVIRTTFEDI
jgi:hypothetical protein